MPRVVPIVRKNVLHQHMQQSAPTEGIVVDSSEWFVWLEQQRAFCFEDPCGTFTARKERRPGGWYWYAYRRYNRKLHTAYLGKTEDLTSERLAEAARALTTSSAQASSNGNRRRQAQQKQRRHPWQRETLLTTKLWFPPLRHDVVVRTHLINRLNEGLRRKLTLISAPAGFGKTTLLSIWRGTPELANQSVAWVSLEPSDNDTTVFWHYVIVAIRTIHPSLLPSAWQLLYSSQPPPLESILIALLNEISVLSKEVLLVLDDYHVIELQQIHDSLAFFLDHLPPSLHLIIASRTDPPLPLARLRAHGHMTELRPTDMRFTLEETSAFLSRVKNLNLSTEQICVLEAQTEGWIAGLQLVALALQQCEDVPGFIAAFSGTHRYIVDYLVAEVLRRQPEPVYVFLLQTSILDQLSSSLCDALTSRTDSQAMLALLEQSNLFLIPLDGERHWYRYHHLFADVLRQHLRQTQAACIPDLHRHAAAWYEQNGMAAEAVRHALAAPDFIWAARLIEQVADMMLMRGELITLLNWLSVLPEDLVRAQPGLSLLRAWILLLTGRLNDVEACLQDAEQAIATLPEGATQSEAASEIVNELAAIRAYLAAIRRDDPRTAESARQTLARLPDDDRNLRCIIMLNLGETYWQDGDIGAASRIFAEAATLSQAAGNMHVALSAMSSLAQLQVLQGQLYKAALIYRQALSLATEAGGQSLPIAGAAYAGLGELLREWNDLDAATRHLNEGIEHNRQWGSVGVLVLNYVTLARVRQAQGDVDGAHEMMWQAEQLTRRTNLETLISRIAAWQARLWIMQSNLKAASYWAADCGLDIDDISSMREIEYLSLARVYLASGQIDEALQLVSRLRRAAEMSGRSGSLIEIMALQSLALQEQGKLESALDLLGTALWLAEPEGYIRTFVDEGAPMRALLLKVVETRQPDHSAALRRVSSDYIGRLLSLIDAASAGRFNENVSVPPLAAGLLEQLSEREIEVLRLIAAGLSNQEIAQRLVVAVSTIKTHVKRIYGKLDAKSRTQAVARARELELL